MRPRVASTDIKMRVRSARLTHSGTIDMFGSSQIVILLCVGSLLVESEARPKPDSAGRAPLPGPGLSYGGIPYGSMSGNVAEYFRGRPSVGHGGALRSADLDYTPIEQYL